MSLWNATKAKIQLRLSVQRLRTLQQKKEAQAKASRRDIASLLERGKEETARIKVETLINEDVYIELLELLELYCELLLARFGILDQKDFSAGVMENRDGCVSERIMRKLDLGTPGQELVDGYLSEIAKAYGVKWAPPGATEVDGKDAGAKEEVPGSSPDKSGPESEIPTSDSKESPETSKKDTNSPQQKEQSPPPTKQPPLDEFEALAQRFAALKKK
ncbi:hypothetical protein NMY22_g6359 [Coprinellus aureogranulatus]|nr:hypothetical protein NMY22_g6359 [Coprinellus aureogranulatus]